ncbi:MAG: VanW family protein [Candidatus Fermentibacteraceae bacterium]
MGNPGKAFSPRRTAGTVYHLLKRYVYWYVSGTRFATDRLSRPLPHTVFAHSSPLIRNLRNTDMWMQYNKITNLKIAVQRLSGLVVGPGLMFSLWRVLGKPTKAKGYLQGMVLCRGKVVPGTGGGLCQLSNLIYWMTLHTPLTVVERWRHGYDVFPDSDRKQPFGSGATCAYPAIDLQLRNDTVSTFQLLLELTETHLSGRWASKAEPAYRYRIVERDHCFRLETWGGYTRNNRLFRQVFDIGSGELTGETQLTENHALMMYSPLIEAPVRP